MVPCLALSIGCSGAAQRGEVGASALEGSARACVDEDGCVDECFNGGVDACLWLGDFYEEEGSPGEAIDAFARGCELGALRGCEEQIAALRGLGREGEAEGVVRELCEADESAERCLSLLTAAAAEGDRSAERRLSERCRAGQQIACVQTGRSARAGGRLDEARGLFDEACAAGLLEGCLALAELLAELDRPEEERQARERARALGAEE